jgi:hypothetical protein
MSRLHLYTFPYAPELKEFTGSYPASILLSLLIHLQKEAHKSEGEYIEIGVQEVLRELGFSRANLHNVRRMLEYYGFYEERKGRPGFWEYRIDFGKLNDTLQDFFVGKYLEGGNDDQAID